MTFLSPEVALYLYKSTIHQGRNTFVTSWLEPLVATWKATMQDCWSFLAAFLEVLAYCQNVASLSLLNRFYFGRCSLELAQLVPFPFS